MWITGFDVPTCSTIYLDKPMKNHTLMQTIARANRRRRARARASSWTTSACSRTCRRRSPSTRRRGATAAPIRDKDELVAELEKALAEARDVLRGRRRGCGRDLRRREARAARADQSGGRGSRRARRAAARLLPRRWGRGAGLQGAAAGRTGGALPEAGRDPARPRRGDPRQARARWTSPPSPPRSRRCWTRRSRAWRSPRRSSRATRRAGRVDLSAIDFEKLAKLFASRPQTAAEKLRSDAEAKAHEMAARNPTRVHLVEKLEKLVEDVQSRHPRRGGVLRGAQGARRRDGGGGTPRGPREGLTEDELAIFDLLTRPEPKLTKAQEVAVKKVARDLLEKLQEQLAVAQWQSKPADPRRRPERPSGSR